MFTDWVVLLNDYVICIVIGAILACRGAFGTVLTFVHLQFAPAYVLTAIKHTLDKHVVTCAFGHADVIGQFVQFTLPPTPCLVMVATHLQITNST